MNQAIYTPDEWLSNLDKPQVEVATKLKVNREDYLIFCAGFEERSLGVVRKLVSEKQVFTAVIICYDPEFPENRLSEAREILAKEGLEHIEATYFRADPQGFTAEVQSIIARCKGRLYIDVSAMSRLLIVQLIVELNRRQLGFNNTSILYTEAAEYPPSEEEARVAVDEAKQNPGVSGLFLSSGVYEIIIVPELGSPSVTNDRTRLIAFPSLEAHHLTALRAELQPASFSFVEGLPSNGNYTWRTKLIAQINSIDTLYADDIERFSVGTMDYEETIRVLQDIYKRHAAQERLILAPTGSKMQTVGVGIFRAYVQDVQIVYPTPTKFRDPARYTIGIGVLHELKLDKFIPFPGV